MPSQPRDARQTTQTALPVLTLSKRFSLIVIACAAISMFVNVRAADSQGYTIGERGEHFSVYEKVTARTHSTIGTVNYYTNSFTLFENGVNYFENNQWKSSEDVIEPFPDGAIVRRSPNKVIFSPDLNSPDVFDMLTSEGNRLRGGVRAIQLTDLATGKNVVLGTVKASAPGQLLPPNQILYADGFTGLKADVLYIWKHSRFSQDVILRERPAFPPDLDPQTTVLEVLTEFVLPPVPLLRKQVLKAQGNPDLEDAALIGFGSTLILRGHAIPAADGKALNFGVWTPGKDSAPVFKQWHQLPDGRTFLVESVWWSDIQAYLQGLPAAQRAERAGRAKTQVASARVWPERPAPRIERKPIQIASLPYAPKGLVIDFDTVPSSSASYTFETGKTYYVPGSTTIGTGLATFQAGSVIKYTNNADLKLTGTVSFPTSRQGPVFTSKDDDGFGEMITGSTHTPSNAAYRAIWLYFPNAAAAVSSARVRWCWAGLEFDGFSGQPQSHTLTDSFLEQCATGVYLNLPSGQLTLTAVTKANVSLPFDGPFQNYTGTMTDSPYTTDKAFVGLTKNDSEYQPNDPPDTQGAVGPSHFVEIVNRVIRVFNKTTGERLEFAAEADFAAFFGETSGDYIDPRLLYDHHCQRWYVCVANRTTGDARLAISKSSDPTGLLTNWDRYALQATESGFVPDYPTLGVDQNGIYVVVHFYNNPLNPTVWKQKVVAIKKPITNCSTYIYQQADIKTPLTLNSPYKWLVMHPAVNFDTVASDGIAWFVAKGDPQGGQGPIHYGRLKWINGTPQFLENPWNNSLTVPRAYYDLDNNFPFPAPQQPCGANNQQLTELTGSRIMMAVVRNGFVWTCHHVGLDGGSNDTYDGGTVDRTACGWFKLKILATDQLSIDTIQGAAYDRVFDTAATNPYYYYFPSLMVNSQDDMVIGFSGSKTTEYIGAFYSGRRASGSVLDKPILVQAGRSYYNFYRWGDYSYTCLDPDDGLTFWTIQEYTETPPTSCPDVYQRYGTWITKIKRHP